jgi:hypothetical protein
MACRCLDNPSIRKSEAKDALASESRPVSHGKDRCGDPSTGPVKRPNHHAGNDLRNGQGPVGRGNSVSRREADPTADVSHKKEIYLSHLSVEYR